MKVVVGVTGASGMPIAERLIEVLRATGNEVILVLSRSAMKIVDQESSIDRMTSFANAFFMDDELDAPISSGSYKFDCMVVVPCSMKTLACIANGIEINLIIRAALVCLKQRRKLILVPRETPLAEPHIVSMLKASRAGAIILPPVLTFYHNPKSVKDIVDFIVGRIMEMMGIEHELYRRWGY